MVWYLDTSAFLAAGTLEAPALRAPDALHLATALELGDDLEGLVTYDVRMAEAATMASITVVAPTAGPTGRSSPGRSDREP